MTTNEIRTKFLKFFESKKHSIIASDSLVPKDDPTVLFTTAGMQQFKPQFLGHIDGFTKAATCQKCLRTDDLEVVGKTDFHQTFFEMLGNFSFGDYFKKEAITWAWEFLTVEMKLPKERLWVSVYQEDTEAYDIWANEIKISESKIVRFGDKSNFWPSNARLNGPNGPCGPCSEIFYDYGFNPNCPKKDECDPDCSCGRFSEVWNLVFTQFNRKDGGVLEPLPAKNIDTGMGLERLAAVVQGKKSNYQTDNFSVIIRTIKWAQSRYSLNLLFESDIRVIADHIRAIVIAIADGVIPSNEGRGYVVRKLIIDSSDLLLRASSTGIKEPMLYNMVNAVVDVMKEPYPEIMAKADEIKSIIKHVEEGFIKLREGKIPELKDSIIINKSNPSALGELFFLYRDTHGLSLSTISSTAAETGIDTEIIEEAMKVFESKMLEQKNRSRAGSKMTGEVYANQDFAANLPKTEFLGYKETKAEAEVLRIYDEHNEIKQANKSQAVKIILNRTPFYAEAGGQVGDSGYLTTSNAKIRITDTQKSNDIYVHSGAVEEGIVKTGDKVLATIDESRRQAIMRNHTATHLLQAALRETLGTHIKQQGSLVDDGRLRFDFTHPKGLGPKEMQQIEARLNELVNRNDKVTTESLSLQEAKTKGALMFFAEKYGATVRVVSIGDYSREFCGGTHVASTADIQAVRIVSEGSVAQGIRRIEALTGKVAVENFINKKNQEAAAIEAAQNLKMQEKVKQEQYFEKIKSSVDGMIASGENIKGSNLIMQSLADIDITFLRKLSDLLKQKVKSGIFILGAKGTDDASVILSVTDDLVARGIKANELIGQITAMIDGSGGGKPQLAQAGSKKPEKLDGALLKAKEIVKGII